MHRRTGFSLLELLVVTAIIAFVLVLMTMSVTTSRSTARRMSCSNSFKQIGLAIHNYHSAYKQMPSMMFGTESNQARISGLVSLFPFVEAGSIWETVSNESTFAGVTYPPMGPARYDVNYPPWQADYRSYRCPESKGPAGITNYLFVVGDQVTGLYGHTDGELQRGPFTPQLYSRFRDLSDGLSNTLLMAETATREDDGLVGNFCLGMGRKIAKSPSSCLDAIHPTLRTLWSPELRRSPKGRGASFADGSGGVGWINTILPPNSISCAIESQPLHEGVFSASSRHARGAHGLLADGSVHFISELIDNGDPSLPADLTNPKSPYGVWGALGTRAGMETTEAAVPATH